MADNVKVPGTGNATVATDQVNGRHFQIVKQAYGPDGTEPEVVSPDHPLPVSTGMAIPQHDAVSLTQGLTTDTYTYTRGGDTVGTLTVTFTDSTKLTLSGAVLT